MTSSKVARARNVIFAGITAVLTVIMLSSMIIPSYRAMAQGYIDLKVRNPITLAYTDGPLNIAAGTVIKFRWRTDLRMDYCVGRGYIDDASMNNIQYWSNVILPSPAGNSEMLFTLPSNAANQTYYFNIECYRSPTLPSVVDVPVIINIV